MKLSEKIQHTKRPFVISGPCSAESETQVHHVFQQLAQTGKVHLFRAGIWKPRTRPDSFEGIGQIALKWVKDASKENHIPVCIEVANAHHAEMALKAEIDAIWIGARTTVNPFTVEEIAQALRGTDIPVLIKNPINPDINLWIGAIERFEKSGLFDITAIHRGFSVYNHRKYRNMPSWEIPIALKEHYPDIPLICDPSHISGRRELLFEVSQKAMDLNFDGLMIESHPSPEKALSDSRQQITPSELNKLLSQLILRSQDAPDSIHSVLQEVREKIANIDDRLFDLISDRMKLSEELGILKYQNNITVLQQKQWEKIIKERLLKKNDYNLSEEFIRGWLNEIHQESIRHQINIMKQQKDGEKN